VVRAVLFDLDGTLVHFDYDEFLQAYIQAVSAAVAHVLNPRTFARELLRCTNVMLANEGPRTNKQVFWDEMLRSIDCDTKHLLDAVDHFYRTDFPRLLDRLRVVPHPDARPMLEHLIREGYTVVIATNAVFPRIATEERMRWGNVHGLPYTLVTTYETWHSCKPNLAYYREILSTINIKPEDCIMIGNDLQEDVVAGKLGMRTYLVDDYLVDHGTPHREPDFRGSFDDMLRFVMSGDLEGLWA